MEMERNALAKQVFAFSAFFSTFIWVFNQNFHNFQVMALKLASRYFLF